MLADNVANNKINFPKLKKLLNISGLAYPYPVTEGLDFCK
jgi:hypothetical protein